MSEKLFDILVDKMWKTKGSLFLVFPLAIMVLVFSLNSLNDNIYKWIVGICIATITIAYTVATIKYNSLPKSNDCKKASILLRIYAKNKEEYEDIKEKFGNEFNKFLAIGKNKTFDIVYIPYHLIENNKSDDLEDIIKMLKKTNCIFLATIKTKSEEMSTDTQYVTELNFGILHNTYPEKVQELFQGEVNYWSRTTRRLEYSKMNKITTLETTAEKLSLVCRYIIGCAYYLNGDLVNAGIIIDELYNMLKAKSSDNFIKNLRDKSKALGFDIHIIKVHIEFSKDNPNLEFIKNELDKADNLIKNTYVYNLNMSTYAFLKNRDVISAKKYIGACKSLEPNGEWKYSEAFLYAYEGESEGRVVYKYMQALKTDTDYMHLIAFIEDILLKEEDKIMLKFALAILYIETGNIDAAKDTMSEYLKIKENAKLEVNTIKRLTKKYGQDIIDKIL